MPFRTALGLLATISACAFLAWSYAVFMRAPAVGVFHDDGVYLVNAKALAEGRGYRIISMPGEPPQTKYPILFPWLLSLVWRVAPTFPDNLLWLRLVPLGASICWGWLSWRLLRRLGVAKGDASIALLLLAASPWILFLSTTLLAESLFAALLTGALLLVHRFHAGDGKRLDAFAAGALMGAAFLARTAGLAPAAAGFALLVWKGKWRAAAQYAVAASLLAVPWILWVSKHGSDPGLDTFYSSTNYASWNLVTNYSWNEKLTVLGINAAYAVTLGQYWGLSAPIWLAAVAAFVCATLVGRGFWFAREWPPAILLAAYVAMLLGWAWPPVRFLVPVLPLLVWLALIGGAKWRGALAAVAIVLLASAASAGSQLVRAVQLKGGTWFAAWGVNDWHQMRQQIDWITRETPPHVVVVAIHDPTYYLFTHRKAIRPFNFDPLLLHYNIRRRPESPFGTVEDFRHRLVAVAADYVVTTPNDGVDPFVVELTGKWPGSMTLVHGTADSGYAIYKVERARLDSASESS